MLLAYACQGVFSASTEPECPEMARLTYGSSRGSYGSLGTQTAWEWLDVHDSDI